MFVDSHCHLDFNCFDTDRDSVIKRCEQLGINTIVIPGTQADRWQSQINLCNIHSQLKFALGLHPYFLQTFDSSHIASLKEMLILNLHNVVAVGEIGLDTKIEVDWTLQVEVFTQQLKLAKEHSLPVILHHRNSHNELIRILKTQKFCYGGIVHAFSGSLEQAHTYIDLGFKIGVGGVITYPRAKKTRETVSKLPLSSLVLETDSPDMPLMGKQGQRNSPEYLPKIFEALLGLRYESKQDVMQACLENVRTSLRHI